ncbi:hypothetical protein [Paenibacillus ferrarius]|uniref:hypothetical protein n=1 Tax=Paenibacillus ferrarius TaxID=1469647 RepID=UPI003D27FD9E
MNLNIYSMEYGMLQRKMEIEKASAVAWQESNERNQLHIFKFLISKFKVAVHTTSANVQRRVETQ